MRGPLILGVTAARIRKAEQNREAVLSFLQTLNKGTAKRYLIGQFGLTPPTASAQNLYAAQWESLAAYTASKGPELLTNGTFDIDLSGWTATGWTWDSGAARHTTGNTSPLSQNVTVSSNKKYYLEITIANMTSGSVRVQLGRYSAPFFGGTSFAQGTWRRIIRPLISGTVAFQIVSTSDFDGTVDNISLREVTGAGIYPAILAPNFHNVPDSTAAGNGLFTDGHSGRALRDFVVEHAAQGGLVYMTTNFINPWTGGGPRDRTTVGWYTELLYSASGTPRDNFIVQLERVAKELQFYQDHGVVVLFRPFMEMNLEWAWWCGRGTPTGNPDQNHQQTQFIALWQDMHNYLTNTKGLRNILWFYCPNIPYSAADPAVDYYYPGDAYVDIVGADYYGTAPDTDLNYLNSYTLLQALGKPMFFGETGPTAVSGGEASIDNRIYLNAVKNYYSDYIGENRYNGWAYDAHNAIIDNNYISEYLNDAWCITREELPSFKPLFSDDFETWSGWVQVGNGTVSQSSEQKRAGTYSLKKTANSGAHGGYKSLGQTVARGVRLSAWCYATSASTGDVQCAIVDADGNGYGFTIEHGSNQISIQKFTSYAPTVLNSGSLDPPEGAWYKVIFEMLEDNSFSLRLFDTNNKWLGGVTAVADTTYTSFDRIAILGGVDYYIDELYLFQGY
jgi:hypothetical protein